MTTPETTSTPEHAGNDVTPTFVLRDNWPVEVAGVVQYAEDGGNANEVREFLADNVRQWSRVGSSGQLNIEIVGRIGWLHLACGQWLTRHLDGTLTVSDDDPRVEVYTLISTARGNRHRVYFEHPRYGTCRIETGWVTVDD